MLPISDAGSNQMLPICVRQAYSMRSTTLTPAKPSSAAGSRSQGVFFGLLNALSYAALVWLNKDVAAVSV